MHFFQRVLQSRFVPDQVYGASNGRPSTSTPNRQRLTGAALAHQRQRWVASQAGLCNVAYGGISERGHSTEPFCSCTRGWAAGKRRVFDRQLTLCLRARAEVDNVRNVPRSIIVRSVACFPGRGPPRIPVRVISRSITRVPLQLKSYVSFRVFRAVLPSNKRPMKEWFGRSVAAARFCRLLRMAVRLSERPQEMRFGRSTYERRIEFSA